MQSANPYLSEMETPAILVAPLNWGLGHATRCIPLIEALGENGFRVVLAADGDALTLLRKEFPDLTAYSLPSYHIAYAKNMVWAMCKKVPRLLWQIHKEHMALQQITAKENVVGIVSDNRYGLWHKQVPAVILTHQTWIKSPVAETLLNRLNHWFLKRFTACWVPDYSGPDNLSGELGHRAALPHTRHIGPLSRFKQPSLAKKFTACLVVSGPEPHRTTWGKALLAQAKELPLKTALVLGDPKNPRQEQVGNCSVFGHAHTAELAQLMSTSEVVICRSGYSSIMDLARLQKKAAMVATPGQTEQTYLADYHAKKGHIASFSEKGFKLEKAIDAAKEINGFPKEKGQPNWPALFTLFAK